MSAKLARQRKEIRRVKAAIRWAEHKKSERAEFVKRRADTKEYVVNSLSWKSQNALPDIKQARLNRIEDWRLGPLRPNRAVGEAAERYGTISGNQSTYGPQIPDHMLWMPEYDLKTKVFPIEEKDRVLILRGREKNRIGIVDKVDKERATVTVKDMNKVWADGRVYHAEEGSEKSNRHEIDYPIPLRDVRLVATRSRLVPNPDDPSETIEVETDFLVEKIELRKYARGVDPKDEQYKTSVPEDHQVYPGTRDPIFMRYIPGSDEVIPWPWELEDRIDEKEEARKKADIAAESEGDKAVLVKAKQRVQEAWRKIWRKKAQEQQHTPEVNEDDSKIVQHKMPIPKPSSQVYVNDDDTTYSEVEHASYEPGILFPPIPHGVIDELRDKYTGKPLIESLWTDEYRKNHGPRGLLAQKAEARRQIAPETDTKPTSIVKTPMQVRRELAQAAKQNFNGTEVPQISKEVLQAIGAVMLKNGIRKPFSTRKPLRFSVADFTAEKEEQRSYSFPEEIESPRQIKFAKSRMRKEKRLLDEGKLLEVD